MSTTVNNEDLELEEGEIAEDSNDDADVTPDLDYADQGGADLPGAANVGGGGGGGGGVAISCEGGPQKKRKKVVRKVRRKIKVKKKVLRKKGASGNNESGGGGGGGGGAGAIGGSNHANVDNKMSSSISSALSHNLNSNKQPMLPSNAPLLPHINQQSLDTNLMLNNQQHQHLLLQQHHQPYHHHHNNQSSLQHHLNLLPQTQQQQHLQPQQLLHQAQPNSTQPHSLWEQQILVLQELERQQQVDQQLNQILRAAATDEDFRIFSSPLTNLANSNQQTMGTQLITPMLANTNISATATSTTNNTTTTITTTTNSPNKPMILHSQTPSSPDDENGKSSYEAISKMLTLLRNSANVSDSSENLEIDNNHLFNNPHETAEDSQEDMKGTIEYSLIPILIEGIDYTKYKLLSQYEPKFKNDPRLNQQT